MNLNLTLVGQMITFAVFVAFTMKYVWPPLMAALEARQAKIADGLAAAERGQNELVLSQQKAKDYLKDAKMQAAKMIETAQQKSDQIIVDAADLARKEADRIMVAGKMEIEKEKHKAKTELQKEASDLIVMALNKILPGQIDAAKNHQLVEQIIRDTKESS